MRIVCNAKELIKKISLLKSVVPARSPLPSITGILISSDMTMFATDLTMGMSVTLEGTIEGEGSYIIPGRKTIDICGKLQSDGDIVLDFDDTTAKLKAGKSRFTLKTLSGDGFPAFPSIPDADKISISSGDLMKVLKNTVYATSSTSFDLYLHGVYLTASGGLLRALASDKRRLSMDSAPCDQEFEGILIPADFAKAISASFKLGTPAWLMVADNQLVCGQDDLVLTSRLLETQYPDVYGMIVVPVEAYTNSITCLMSEFRNAIDMALLLSNPLDNRITIDAGEGALNIKAAHDVGDAFNVVDAICDPLEKAYLNGIFVRNILNTLEGEKVVLRYDNPTQPFGLQGDGSVLGIIMPQLP